jgi:hypothetical protein
LAAFAATILLNVACKTFLRGHDLRSIREIVMPGKSPAWPGRHPSQPQRNANKVIAEITTDKQVHTKLDSFSNSAAR